MLNLTKAVRHLKKEREQARRKLVQLDAALRALGSLGSSNRRFGRTQTVAKKRRPMSAAGRKRVAAAQRARWAKWKAARRGK
jgi:small-conductance mechanosensitive channel